MPNPPPRACFFIDGSNWYHSLKQLGVNSPGDLDYAKLCTKLAGSGRQWTATRFYVGRVNQNEAPDLYAAQRRFISRMENTDSRITVTYGRLESRIVENECAKELRGFLSALATRIPPAAFRGLRDIADRHRKVRVTVEKAVDVNLAIDLVVMAHTDAYDAAYLLSADGDYTPAVEAVRSHGKTVYVATPARCAQLAAVATRALPLKSDFFADCWHD